jgi:hypothetical protein
MTEKKKTEIAPAVFVCSGCGKPIREGEPYTDILGEQFCAGCITANTRVAEKTDECNSTEAYHGN